MSLGLALQNLFKSPGPGIAPGYPQEGLRDTSGDPGAPQSPGMPTMPKPMSHGQIIAGILADALAGAAGRPGGFGQMLGQQRQQQQEEVQWQRRRADNLQDYGAQKAIDQRYAKPPAPYRTTDNAGNVWEQGPDGKFNRIFTDNAPKQYIQDGMLVNVPNPYATPAGAAPPPTIDENLWNTGKPVGGPTPSASGTFPR